MASERESIPPEEMVMWVKMRHEQRLALSQISKRAGRSSAVVSRGIKRALDEGLARINVVAGRRGRIDPLEARLKECFGIETPLVVDCSVSQEEDINDGSDAVHRALGTVLAEYLSKNSLVIHEKDTIGIGSGRGPFETAAAFLRHHESIPPIDRKEIFVVSLAGFLGQQGAPSRGPSCIPDADVTCGILPSAFNAEVQASGARRDCYGADLGANDGLSRELDELYSGKLDKAIIGVGALCGRNRILGMAARALRGEMGQSDPIAMFGKLAEESTAIHDQFKDPEDRYYPVGDLCNRLFAVVPPTGGPEIEDGFRSLNDIIAGIHKWTYAIPDQRLREIDTLLVIAGDVRKSAAVYNVLCLKKDGTLGDPGNLRDRAQRKYPVKLFCTDRDVAEALIDWAENGYLAKENR